MSAVGAAEDLTAGVVDAHAERSADAEIRTALTAKRV
jgi:hypothetical protein